MALSKEKLSLPGSAAEAPRQPKCTRCRHHGIVVPQKGHMKRCPFLTCDCWRCLLITERTRITALQRNLRKAEEKKQPSDSVRRPAAPEASSGSASHPSPEYLATTARDPLGVWRAPTVGGERGTGSDPGNAPSFPGIPVNFTPFGR